MKEPLVVVDRTQRIATLTLNRPDRLNAFNPALVGTLRRTFWTESRRKDVDAVVLTGAGRAFCAGGDVGAMRDALAKDPKSLFLRLTASLHPLLLAIRACPKPVIAALNGPVAGGGFGLALACDRRVGTESVAFKPAYATLGIVPDGGISYLLPRIVGWAAAQRIILDDATIGAQEAKALGLVDELVDPGDLLPRARDVALRLARLPPQTFAWTKDLLHRSLLAGYAQHLKLERSRNARSARKDVLREGIAAFFEKRTPKFR